MEVNYYLTSEFKEYEELEKNLIMEIIELMVYNISKEEEEILKKINIDYKIYNDKKVKIKLVNFISYIVEKDDEERGIYIGETLEYNKFFNEASIILNKNKSFLNLVISKEKTRVEVIIEKDEKYEKNKI